MCLFEKEMSNNCIETFKEKYLKSLIFLSQNFPNLLRQKSVTQNVLKRNFLTQIFGFFNTKFF